MLWPRYTKLPLDQCERSQGLPSATTRGLEAMLSLIEHISAASHTSDGMCCVLGDGAVFMYRRLCEEQYMYKMAM